MLTRGDDPPALGEPAPLLKAGELGCAFLPLLGHLPNMVVSYAKEAATTFASDPPPPANTPEYLARLVPCLLYTSPSPRDQRGSRMPSSA